MATPPTSPAPTAAPPSKSTSLTVFELSGGHVSLEMPAQRYIALMNTMLAAGRAVLWSCIHNRVRG